MPFPYCVIFILETGRTEVTSTTPFSLPLKIIYSVKRFKVTLEFVIIAGADLLPAVKQYLTYVLFAVVTQSFIRLSHVVLSL